MTLEIFQVDAFSNQLFKGNPAAVVMLEQWLDDQVLQNIAKENNLSETAFLVGQSDKYDLRWFTPSIEVPLCGHATLASAHVLFQELDSQTDSLSFHTKSGELRVKKILDGYELDLPAFNYERSVLPKSIADLIGFEPEEVLIADNNWVLVTTESNVREFNKNFIHLDSEKDGVIVTSASQSEAASVISRYFGFKHLGIEEDPVTGAAHCAIIKYWCEQLGTNTFNAYQASERGGYLKCQLTAERALISGSAVTYMKGFLEI